MNLTQFVYITAAADQREARERPDSPPTTTSPHYHRNGTAVLRWWISSQILELLSDVNIMMISQLRSSHIFLIFTKNNESGGLLSREPGGTSEKSHELDQLDQK